MSATRILRQRAAGRCGADAALALCLTVACIALCSAPSHAAERYWIDAAGGSFTDTGNWSATDGGAGGAGVPTASDLAIFRISNTYTVTFPGRGILDPPLTYALGITLQDKGNVTWADGGGLNKLPAAVTATQLVLTRAGVGTTPKSLTSTLASLTVASASIAPNSATNNALNVSGGVMTVTGAAGGGVVVADGPDSIGALNVTGGADLAVNGSSPFLVIGKANSAITQGTATVSGAGSTVTVGAGGTIVLGDRTTSGEAGAAPTGVLNVLAGGSVSGGSAALANSPGATGNATVDGAGSIWTVGGLDVGQAGQSALLVRNGAALVSSTASLGRLATGDGEATIDGLGNVGTWTNAGSLTVGDAGGGTLSVLHAGQLASGSAVLGHAAGGTGEVLLDGIGSTWTNSGALTVGRAGAGTLNVIGGAQLDSGPAILGENSTGMGSVLVDGASSAWSVDGDLVIGAGATQTSSVRLNGGELSATGSITVGSHGVLKGKGVVTGAVTNGGTVSPGLSAGKLQVTGSYAQTAGGLLEIELGGTTPDTQYDRLVVSGGIALDGALTVTLINGFVPAAGQTFEILDGGISGAISTMTLPTLEPGLAWNLGSFYTAGVLRVASTLYTADFNENGVVDANDLELWKLGAGTASGAAHGQGDADGDGDVDGGDFLMWQRQLGSAGAAASGVAAPEAGAVSLASWAAAAMLGWRRMFARRRAPGA
jgi:fibronectin-binding autotransporter adhesin